MEYFTSVVIGHAGAIRKDAFADEDFSVLTQGVIANHYALSFCGWAYARANAGMLRQVPLDNGSGPKEPSRDAIVSGVYPLSRPLFIYLNKAALSRPELNDFVTFYMSQVAAVAEEVGYVTLPDATYDRIRDRIARRVGGSCYASAPKGTPVDKALDGAFTPVAAAPSAASASASAPATTPAATAATASPATPVAAVEGSAHDTGAAPGPAATRSEPTAALSEGEARQRRALLARVRDASLTLARLSLDQDATMGDIDRAEQDARSAIEAFRTASSPGSANPGMTLAQAAP